MLKKSAFLENRILPEPSAKKLLAWYDRYGRDLPWRGLKGPHKDYKIWLSEIMLQQTTVAAGIPYYHAFLEKWPTLSDLAAASLDDVLQAWAGLGYYARARNLHACAKKVRDDHAGAFPESEDALLHLPGIGPYTAAALCAILTDQNSVVIDGNVERVISRLYAIDTPLPRAKPEIRLYATRLTPDVRAGDYAQALMDLGATICTPRGPKCDLCVWSKSCLALHTLTQEEYPKKQSRKPKPKRYGSVFFIEDDAGNILLEKRPAKGIFGGMFVFPGTQWDQKSAVHKPKGSDIEAAAPIKGVWDKSNHTVRHVFTHFDLELDIYYGAATQADLDASYHWCAKDKVLSKGLPSAMKKVAVLMI